MYIDCFFKMSLNNSMESQFGCAKDFTPSSSQNAKCARTSKSTESNPISQSPTHQPQTYRHSRSYRHFKNPPQPHMCIRVMTTDKETLFINVLSWTRIVIPQQPSDPIPLYGGMKVHPGSSRCPSLVYAVMANPEVLKDSGRHSKDPEERNAMVELMCDFVEAMNPDIKLTRNADILRDRDISGELKDVWNAVQAQRDKEREEQIAQQYTSLTPKQMFPSELPQIHQINSSNDGAILYTDFGPDNTFINKHDEEQLHIQQENVQETVANDDNHDLSISSKETGTDISKQINLSGYEKTANLLSTNNSSLQHNLSNHVSVTENDKNATIPMTTTTAKESVTKNPEPIAVPLVQKKDKLSGFLPNGCHNIFPRLKNNKNKDKDKDKEKDVDSRNIQAKDKPTLHAYKKPPLTTVDKDCNINQEIDYQSTQGDQSFASLETELEKLDINKLDVPGREVIVKLKVASGK